MLLHMNEIFYNCRCDLSKICFFYGVAKKSFLHEAFVAQLDSIQAIHVFL